MPLKSLGQRKNRTITRSLVVWVVAALAVGYVCAMIRYMGGWRSQYTAPVTAKDQDPGQLLPAGEHTNTNPPIAKHMTGPRPRAFKGAAPGLEHGPLGRRMDGTPLWTPIPLTSKLLLMSQSGIQSNEKLMMGGFFVKKSDSISLDRPVPDHRDTCCKRLQYPPLASLPSTTIIFTFCNEPLSTLLRSIHSVLNTSPSQLLQEVILVDDGSSAPHLLPGAELDEHIRTLPKVRLIRMGERSGLMRARVKGARAAISDTITFLDCHIETTTGWLEPLMARIWEDDTNVVMPIIDGIDAVTFEYKAGAGIHLVGFTPGLIDHGIPLQKKDEVMVKSSCDPQPSPAMAGGLLSISQRFFTEIGEYDQDMEFWGGENVEISFRIWQCGGRLDLVPCSRVGHVFSQGPKPWNGHADAAKRNKWRAALIWMDEYGELVKAALGPKPNVGPLDKMQKLRKDLKCKPFSWYLKEVYPEHPLEPFKDPIAFGMMHNKGAHQCIDTMGQRSGPLGLFGCHGQGGPQAFMLSRGGSWLALAEEDTCVVALGGMNQPLVLQYCSIGQQSKRSWRIDTTVGAIVSLEHDLCVASSPQQKIVLEACVDPPPKRQVWSWNENV